MIAHRVQGWLVTREVGLGGILLSVSSFQNP